MAQFGLTDLGLSTMAFVDIVANMEASLRVAFGAGIPLGDRTLFGIIVRIFSDALATVWDLIQVLYAAMDVDAATGVMLEAISAYTGTFRPDATHSEVTLTLVGTNGTAVPSSSLAATASTNSSFKTIEDGLIAAATVYAFLTAYVVGDHVTNTTTLYVCTIAGTSSSGPHGLDDIPAGQTISSGSVTFLSLGPGTAFANVDAIAVDTGPVAGAAFDITIVQTPIFGWARVVNPLDAVEGTDVGTDEDLRVLREAELSSNGDATADAIKADILAIDPVDILSVTVFHNDTDFTNALGLPPHSVQALVRTNWTADPIKDQPIIDILGKTVAAGIQTVGTTSGTFVDDAGISHTIFFSRPTEVPIYVQVTLTYDATVYPTDGDSQIKIQIATTGNARDAGSDAVATYIGGQAFRIAGVLDVPRSGSLGGCLISTSPSPTADTTIAIDPLHLATYDTSRITIVSTPGTP